MTPKKSALHLFATNLIFLLVSLRASHAFDPNTPLHRISHNVNPRAVNNDPYTRFLGNNRISSKPCSVPLFMATDNKSVISNPYSALLDRPLLAAIDFLSLALFAALGKASHAPDGSVDLASLLATAFPFFAAWFGIAPLLGCYDADATSKEKTLETSLKGWILAVPAGCALRGWIKGYLPPLPFVIVTMVSTLLILGGARFAYSTVREKLTSKYD